MIKGSFKSESETEIRMNNYKLDQLYSPMHSFLEYPYELLYLYHENHWMQMTNHQENEIDDGNSLEKKIDRLDLNSVKNEVFLDYRINF